MRRARERGSQDMERDMEMDCVRKDGWNDEKEILAAFLCSCLAVVFHCLEKRNRKRLRGKREAYFSFSPSCITKPAATASLQPTRSHRRLCRCGHRRLSLSLSASRRRGSDVLPVSGWREAVRVRRPTGKEASFVPGTGCCVAGSQIRTSRDTASRWEEREKEVGQRKTQVISMRREEEERKRSRGRGREREGEDRLKGK